MDRANQYSDRLRCQSSTICAIPRVVRLCCLPPLLAGLRMMTVRLSLKLSVRCRRISLIAGIFIWDVSRR